MESQPQLEPLKLSKADFFRSNVFITWSAKVNREVRLIGPAQFDAWLLLEFDSEISSFCERPPLAIEMRNTARSSRPVDFWIHTRRDKQLGIVLYDGSQRREHALPLEVLQSSLQASELPCDLWLASDLRQRAVYMRNLKQMQPYMAVENQRDIYLEDTVLHSLKELPSTWERLFALVPPMPRQAFDSCIVRLIHQGRITSDLETYPLSSQTLLSLK